MGMSTVWVHNSGEAAAPAFAAISLSRLIKCKTNFYSHKIDL